MLATGAHERGIAYANNDLPGTLLAGAAAPTSSATRCGPDRAPSCSPTTTARTRRRSRCTARGSTSPRSSTRGRERRSTARCRTRRARPACRSSRSPSSSARTAALRVAAVDVAPLAGGSARRIECDLVALSGGWNPAVHLHSQARGKLRYDDALATFVPDGSPAPITPAGAANGRFDLAGGAGGGSRRRPRRRRAGGRSRPATASPPRMPRRSRAGAPQPLWSVPARARGAKRFVDWQNDVTVDDIALAAREGYRSVEHLKRYTTLGMGTDQGKAVQHRRPRAAGGAARRCRSPQVGTTTFRPPYTPVALGAFPGLDVGRARRADALLGDARLACRAWRALRQRGPLEAAALVSARGRIGGRRRVARGAERPRQRRRRRRVDAGQDRAAGTRRRGIPEPRLHQPLGHARGRAAAAMA